MKAITLRLVVNDHDAALLQQRAGHARTRGVATRQAGALPVDLYAHSIAVVGDVEDLGPGFVVSHWPIMTGVPVAMEHVETVTTDNASQARDQALKALSQGRCAHIAVRPEMT